MTRSLSRTMLATGIGALLAGSTALAADDLTEVKFGTNWLPQAEHGGYYQALADGLYEECGLDLTIQPGGPQVNNRALLMAGRIDFLMGGNLLLAFSAAEQNIPLKVVAAHFQKTVVGNGHPAVHQAVQCRTGYMDGPIDDLRGKFKLFDGTVSRNRRLAQS